MVWNIITDSSCDLEEFVLQEGDHTINYKSVPFIISVDSKDYIDVEGMDTDEMLEAMEKSAQISRTSCPTPASWEELFRTEGNVIAVTISKELSGSYNSACVAKDMIMEEYPDKNIAIINSVSAGAGLVVILRTICESILSGASFAECVAHTQEIAAKKQTVFALSSFDNLVKNGRMSKMAGFVARRLNFWGIGVATSEGKIDVKDKVRGSKKALKAIVEDIKNNRTTLRRVVISHCHNLEMAENLKNELLEIWRDLAIEIHATRGLCSFYAERHGLIVAYH